MNFEENSTRKYPNLMAKTTAHTHQTNIYIYCHIHNLVTAKRINGNLYLLY